MKYIEEKRTVTPTGGLPKTSSAVSPLYDMNGACVPASKESTNLQEIQRNLQERFDTDSKSPAEASYPYVPGVLPPENAQGGGY